MAHSHYYSLCLLIRRIPRFFGITPPTFSFVYLDWIGLDRSSAERTVLESAGRDR